MNNPRIQAQAILELSRRYKKRNESYQSRMEYYKKHPYEYCVEKLCVSPASFNWLLFPEYVKHSWDGTVNPIMEMINSLAENKWVRVRSGVSTNKTFTAACIVLWFLECFTGAYVITTAPKKDQLHSQIWSEISKLYPIFNKGTLLTGELRMDDRPDTKYKAEAFVAGTKATKESEEKAQGFHAEHMLIIIEETPGMPLPVLNALINTSTSSHNLVLCLGNPNSKTDNFRAFDKLSNVEDIRISGLDHPNVVLKKEIIPGAQTEAGIQRLKDKFTEQSPMYQSRARGRIPDSSIDSLINSEWIDAAVKCYNELCDEKGKLQIDLVFEYNNKLNISNFSGAGVDVANSETGDEAAICEGIGIVPLCVDSFPCPNSNDLGNYVARLANDNDIPKDRVKVDGIGIGAGTVNTLTGNYGYDKFSIDFQSAASPIDIPEDIERYNNKRSQAWWKVREAIRTGKLPLINDDELITDLTTPKYKIMKGKICIETKQDIKKRLNRSPNKGDAFVYWFWNNVISTIPFGSAVETKELPKTGQNYSSRKLTNKIGIK